MGIKDHRGFKIFIIILLIAFLLFTNKDNQIKFIQVFKGLSTRNKTLELVEEIAIEDSSQIYLFENTIVKWNHNNIAFLNLDGTIRLKKDLHFENPHMVFGDNTIYIMDKDRGSLYFLNTEGETIKRIELNEEIIDLKIKGETLIVNTRLQDMEGLQILDMNGMLIKKHIIDNENMLNYAVNEDENKYLVSTLNLEDTQLKSNISIYSIEDEEITKLNIPKEIVLLNEFVKENIIIVTDMGLYLIKDGEIQWNKPIKSPEDMRLIDDKIWLLYDNSLEVINLKGKTETKFNVGYNFNKIIPFGNYTLLYGQDKMWGIQEDKVILEYEGTSELIDLGTSTSMIGIYEENKLYLYKLNDEEGEKH